MIEKNVSEEAKAALTYKPVLDEMPERIKMSYPEDKEKEDFVNWSVGMIYDQIKDSSLDDLILYILRREGFDKLSKVREDQIRVHQDEVVFNALVHNDMAVWHEDEDGNCILDHKID